MQLIYSQTQVLEELQTVLQDAKFAAAPQMSAFLKFVVMQTLEGKADRIKAYTVAVDALGKPSTFDPQNDPSVRVLAKRLRDTLTAYYKRTTDHTLMLKLNCGSYVPNFEPFVEEQTEVQPVTEAETKKETNPELKSMLQASNVTTIARSTEKNNIVTTRLANDDNMFSGNKSVKR